MAGIEAVVTPMRIVEQCKRRSEGLPYEQGVCVDYVRVSIVVSDDQSENDAHFPMTTWRPRKMRLCGNTIHCGIVPLTDHRLGEMRYTHTYHCCDCSHAGKCQVKHRLEQRVRSSREYHVSDPVSNAYRMRESMTLFRLMLRGETDPSTAQTEQAAYYPASTRLVCKRKNSDPVIKTSTADESERPRVKTHFFIEVRREIKRHVCCNVRRHAFRNLKSYENES